MTYYDSTGLPKYLDPGEKIVDAYNNEEIILEVLRKSNVTEVIVRNAREELLKEELIGDFRYCRLFAWGDKVEYKIDTKISISKK